MVSLSSCTLTVQWLGFWHMDLSQVAGQPGRGRRGCGWQGPSQPARGAGSGPGPPAPRGQAHWTDPAGVPGLPSSLSDFLGMSWGPEGSRSPRCHLPPAPCPRERMTPEESPCEGPIGAAPGLLGRQSGVANFIPRQAGPGICLEWLIREAIHF